MGKYIGDSVGIRVAEHPFLKIPMFVPEDYTFFKQAEYGKLASASKWLGQFAHWAPLRERGVVIEAYAGAGILSMIYLEAGYMPLGIEIKEGLTKALRKNFERYPDSPSLALNLDNAAVLREMDTDCRITKIIDLDCYSHCIPQIQEAARILKRGLLFVSSGEAISICRFRKYFLAEKRYGISFSGPTYKDFPEKVMYEFIRREFAKRGKKAEFVEAVARPTLYRLCVKVL